VTRTGVSCWALAASLGCYSYVPATLDAVPVGAKLRAVVSTEAELRLRDSLGLDLRALHGTLVERGDTRLLVEVRTGSGSRDFGGQPLYQRIALTPADVLRVDVRRMHRVRTGLLGAGLVGAAVWVAAAIGILRPGTPDQGGGGPSELRWPGGSGAVSSNGRPP